MVVYATWGAFELALSPRALGAPNAGSTTRASGQGDTKLTFYILDVQVHTFFYDSFGHKLAFKVVALSNSGVMMTCPTQLCHVGREESGMGLMLELHGTYHVVARR
eukprot:1456626-Amphidinium_carterae.1